MKKTGIDAGKKTIFYILMPVLVVLTTYMLVSNHGYATNPTITVMDDEVASTTVSIYSGRQITAEQANSTSVLVGKYIDSVTLQMKKLGSPTGTAYIGVFNTDLSLKKVIGTLDVSTLTTTLANYNFATSSSAPYKIQSGDRIGIKYSGGDMSNEVLVEKDTTNAFDGKNSVRVTYVSSWSTSSTEDQWMILTVTQPVLAASTTSSTSIHLSWTAPLNATSFLIARESPVGHGFSTIVSDTGSSATTYDDTGLAPNTQYNYRVTVRDSSGLLTWYNSTTSAATTQHSSVIEFFTTAFEINDDNGNKTRLHIDGSGNVGIGTRNPVQKLDVNGTVHLTGLNVNEITKTAAYTLTSTDDTVLGNSTGGAFTLTIPTAVGSAGKLYDIKKIDSSTNAITIATTSSQTIDGATSLSLSSQYDFVVLESDGKNWNVLAGNSYAGNINLKGNLASTASSGTFKITAPSGVAICIGNGC